MRHYFKWVCLFLLTISAVVSRVRRGSNGNKVWWAIRNIIVEHYSLTLIFSVSEKMFYFIFGVWMLYGSRVVHREVKELKLQYKIN